MSEDSKKLIEKITRLVQDLKTDSVRVSYKISPEVETMISALSTKGETTKDVLVTTVLKFVMSTNDIEPTPFGKIFGGEDSCENHSGYKTWLLEKGLTSEDASNLSSYLEDSYENIAALLESIHKSIQSKKGKSTKTFVISSGIKRFIDRYAAAADISKSGFFEFLIRTRHAQEVGLELEKAKKYAGPFTNIRNKLTAAFDNLSDVRQHAYGLLAVHHLDRDKDIFYPEYITPDDDQYNNLELIQIAMGNLQILLSRLEEDVLVPMSEAALAEEEVIKSNGLDPSDFIHQGGKK